MTNIPTPGKLYKLKKELCATILTTPYYIYVPANNIVLCIESSKESIERTMIKKILKTERVKITFLIAPSKTVWFEGCYQIDAGISSIETVMENRFEAL